MGYIALPIANVSWPECFESLKLDVDSYIVDVRTSEEWNDTGVADLSPLNNNRVKLITWVFLKPTPSPNSNFLTELSNMINDKKAKLYFMCKSGGRSAQAAAASMRAGYNNCFNVEHGFTADIPWRKS